MLKWAHLWANWLKTAIRYANTCFVNCRHTNQVQALKKCTKTYKPTCMHTHTKAQIYQMKFAQHSSSMSWTMDWDGILDVVLSLFPGADAQCALPALDTTTTAAVKDSPRVQYGERSYSRTPGSGDFQTLTAPPSLDNRANQTANPVTHTPLSRPHWGLNPRIRKHWRTNFFKTLNDSKLILDPRSKPNELLCGHLNIRSIVS